MSSFTLEIYDVKNTLEIETSILNVTNNIELETTYNQYIEVSTGFAGSVVYASDVIGLDNYLSNFIDNYEIDCGSP